MTQDTPLSADAAIAIPTWVDGELRPYDKLAAHLEGLRHKAVSVFVMDGPDVLIQRRALGKYHTPGLWANTCCTHPFWDEPAAICAVRRLDQELGLTGVEPQHRGCVEYRAEVGGGMIEHEVVDVFVARKTPQMTLRPNPDEVMDTAWVNYDDLIRQVSSAPETFTPWLRIYLAQHSAMIFGG